MADGTKIQRVTFESDFTLRLKAVDTEGNELDEFPSGDFEIVFTCGGRKYSCSRRGERYTNCKMNDDGTLTVVFDSHNLLPGVLRMKMFLHLPNALYPDGEQTVAGGCIALGVELVACGGDDFSTEFDAELVMPYAIITAYQMAVSAGYKGTEKEWLEMMTQGGKIAYKQEEGQDTDAAMSQKATTDALEKRDEALQEYMDKMRAQLMTVYCLVQFGANPVFVGADASYSVKAEASDTADTLSILRNGESIVVAKDAKECSTSDKPVLSARGSVIYTAQATVGKAVKKSYSTVYVVLPIYLGSGATYKDVMNEECKLSARRTPKGSYGVAVKKKGEYLWLVLPDDMTFSGAKMNGFGLPFERTSDKEADYIVYRSENAYNAGQLNFEIL